MNEKFWKIPETEMVSCIVWYITQTITEVKWGCQYGNRSDLIVL